MIYEIIFFYKKVSTTLQKHEKITLGEYLSKNNLSNYFINYHIIPMVASIWSMPYGKAKDMPFKLFVEFFQITDYSNLEIAHNGLQLKIEADHM